MHIAVSLAIHKKLLPALTELTGALDEKSKEFHEIIKIGRTHCQVRVTTQAESVLVCRSITSFLLQDATPRRLGQEFGGYTEQMKNGIERVNSTLPRLYRLAAGFSTSNELT